MNGIHDLGGMEGFGPINPEPEAEEPVFHTAWEGRVFALNRVTAYLQEWNLDMFRFARERQPAARFLSGTYYENWLSALETMLIEAGLVTAEELESGKELSPVPDALKNAALRAEQVGKVPLRVTNFRREIDAPPRFAAGDRVRAINRHPSHHTREPRYVRGHYGTVYEHYGVQVFPDLSAQGTDEGRHLYSVRFNAQELWGDTADAETTVYVDMFEDYLEEAD